MNTARPTSLDREELYLRQLAYAISPKWTGTHLSPTLAKLSDQGARVAAARAEISKLINTDVTKLPGYNPEPQPQIFEQGARVNFRPDLRGPEWEKFQKDYRIHHMNTNGDLPGTIDRVLSSGGMFAPTTDKLRRGISPGGWSPEPDLESGGASYFFTRINTKDTASRRPGFIWPARHIGRLDAISYDDDYFGRTTGDFVTLNRKTTIADWKQNATRVERNETNFKHGLSLLEAEAINTSSAAERQAVLQVLRKHKVTTWPDGRPIEDVVLVMGKQVKP